MLAGLAIVCDEYFVPALEVMTDAFGIGNDVAGATLMAAGGSAPELATSFIGLFIVKSDVGFGTIVGSAVFNVLFVIGACAMASKEVLVLTSWPLTRDCSYYIFSLIILYLFFGTITPNQVSLRALVRVCAESERQRNRRENRRRGAGAERTVILRGCAFTTP